MAIYIFRPPKEPKEAFGFDVNGTSIVIEALPQEAPALSLDKAKDYVNLKLRKKTQEKNKKLAKLPKSLYLVLIKEERSGKTFVKVGITSKRFIMRRFSKAYGYDGYVLESILRRIDTPEAERLESEIKEKLNKKRSVKKYRPLLESFSGYSECFDYNGLNDIVKIFDDIAYSSM